MKRFMKLNKETANRLWVQQFGKRQKVIDYSGREIAKAAYNDRNSTYGWNVDHVLPQSRGGKTADYNLVCCHILTNDEKADKFPCFKANAKKFEIQKRQNHYEIIEKTGEQKKEVDEIVNFLDAAQGLKCWKQCKSRSDNAFAGYVKVKVETVSKSDRIIERYGKFLAELFGTGSVFAEDGGTGYFNGCSMWAGQCNRVYVFTVIVGGILPEKDTENLLGDCVTLNTYNDYFINSTELKDIRIACGMECYENRLEMSLRCKKDILDKKVQFYGSLIIDELVKRNTSAKEKLKDFFPQNKFYPYNFIFPKLKDNLSKHI